MSYRICFFCLRPEELQQLQDAMLQLDLQPGPGGSRGSDAAATLRLCAPILQPYFPSPSQMRVFALYPSSQIVAHTDPPIEGARYHIPLQSNDGCWCLHGELWQRLKIGSIYQMDPTVVHGAVNWGTTVRLHLTIDA